MNYVEKARKLRPLIEKAVNSLDDKDATDAIVLFAEWNGGGVAYKENDKVRYKDVLYKCLQDHTSQSGWNPEQAPSLWARVLIPDPDVVPEWVQPDSTNPYMKGDKVRHNNVTWQSLIDNNVWEPGAVGTESLWDRLVG